MPPQRMAAIWPAEEVLNRMMSADTTAIEARSRSGHNTCAIPQTAWAMIATATSFSPCKRPVPIGPSSVPAP